MKFLVLIQSVTISLSSFAAPMEKPDQWLLNGKPVQQSESRQSKNGFAAMVLITSDADYREKWEKPTTPSFTPAKSVQMGGTIFILVFFSNPKLDEKMTASIECDFKVTRPDGSISLEKKGLSCFQNQLLTNLKNLYMTHESIGFRRDPPDPKGKWLVTINVTDKNRGTTIPLKTSFDLN